MMLFFKEYKSWLLLLLMLNVMANGLLMLDEGLEGISQLYFNIVYILMVIVFCIWRAQADKQILQTFEHATLTPIKATIVAHYRMQSEALEKALQTYKVEVAEHSDEMLAWVHEMKAPLTAMQLLIEQMPADEMKNRLQQEWLRIYDLLDHQLYIARLQTIEQDSRYEPVQLQQTVVREIKHFQAWCIQKGIGFELEGLEQEVLTDAKWLSFIVRQYISNAIKYSEPNSEVSVFTTITEDHHLQLHIRDAGKGIAAHDLPRVFQKSYTGSTGRESSAASGMGLYLAKQAADKLALKLSIESAVGLGTTAKIQFPLENEYMKVGM